MRNPLLDTAKFVLVALVVIGHLLEPLVSAPEVAALYRFLYLFHIPALAYVSGVVASAEIGPRQGKRWLAGLMLPLLVFQALYLAWDATLFDKPFAYQVAQPYWLLWYLMSLAWWRLLLPVVTSIRWPLATSVTIALLVGGLVDVNYTWSASRTLVFFPFFLAGHLYGARMPGPRWAGVIGLLVLAGVAWSLRFWPATWLLGSVPYASLHETAWVPGMLIRAGLLACGALGTWSVLRLLPAGEGWFSRLGQRSMSAYLLHGFLVKWAVVAGVFASLKGWSWHARMASGVATGLALTVLLSWLGRPLKPLMDYGWLWRGARRG